MAPFLFCWEDGLFRRERLPRAGACLLLSQGVAAFAFLLAEPYALLDRGTFLAQQKNLDLAILLEGDPGLFNVYHVIVVNPAKHAGINAEGARAFSQFVSSAAVQEMIRSFGVDRYGEPLFVPDAYLASGPGGEAQP